MQRISTEPSHHPHHYSDTVSLKLISLLLDPDQVIMRSAAVELRCHWSSIMILIIGIRVLIMARRYRLSRSMCLIACVYLFTCLLSSIANCKYSCIKYACSMSWLHHCKRKRIKDLLLFAFIACFFEF